MFAISRILTPVVFSENCRGALCYAAGVAHRFQAELTVLHVLEPLKLVDLDSPLGVQELEKARRSWVERTLSEWTFDLKPETNLKLLIVEGDPATEITRTADRSGTDLIVIATHGHGPFRRFLLGSVTAKVLHDATCAVWTGAHLEQALAHKASAGKDIALVLCAVDFGDHMDSAVDWAAGIAAAYGAQLALLHVLSPPYEHDTLQAMVSDVHERLAHRARALLGGAGCHVAIGDASKEIAAQARTLQADLLVIGRGHWRGGGRLRSTSYAIIRESPCPVVSV